MVQSRPWNSEVCQSIHKVDDTRPLLHESLWSAGKIPDFYAKPKFCFDCTGGDHITSSTLLLLLCRNSEVRCCWAELCKFLVLLFGVHMAALVHLVQKVDIRGNPFSKRVEFQRLGELYWSCTTGCSEFLFWLVGIRNTNFCLWIYWSGTPGCICDTIVNCFTNFHGSVRAEHDSMHTYRSKHRATRCAYGKTMVQTYHNLHPYIWAFLNVCAFGLQSLDCIYFYRWSRSQRPNREVYAYSRHQIYSARLSGATGSRPNTSS